MNKDDEGVEQLERLLNGYFTMERLVRFVACHLNSEGKFHFGLCAVPARLFQFGMIDAETFSLLISDLNKFFGTSHYAFPQDREGWFERLKWLDKRIEELKAERPFLGNCRVEPLREPSQSEGL